MLSYQTLDTIADAYTPLLAIVALSILARTLIEKHWKRSALLALQLFSGVAIAYLLMFLDNALGLWPTLGMDYSTHSAVALVLVLFLSRTSKKSSLFWLLSFVGYALLMLYQQYHTVADIISTTLVVGCCYALSMRLLSKIANSG